MLAPGALGRLRGWRHLDGSMKWSWNKEFAMVSHDRRESIHEASRKEAWNLCTFNRKWRRRGTCSQISEGSIDQRVFLPSFFNLSPTHQHHQTIFNSSRLISELALPSPPHFFSTVFARAISTYWFSTISVLHQHISSPPSPDRRHRLPANRLLTQQTLACHF
jgi:hypothetical protein